MAIWILIFKRARQAQFLHNVLVDKTENVYFFKLKEILLLPFFQIPSGFQFEKISKECPFQGPVFFDLP